MAVERNALIVVEALGGDVGDADDLAEQLRRELHETGLDVTRPAPGEAPDLTKGDALAWAQLAVSFSGGLPALVAAIHAFTQRDESRKVSVTLDNDTLEISGPTSRQQQQVVDSWLARHSPAAAQATESESPGKQ
jgi:membrane-associated two-gene conflict system component 1 (EACC1)